MAYNRKVIKKVLGDFESKGKLAIAMADKRKQELYEKLPELHSIDCELAKTQLNLVNDILSKGGNVAEKIELTRQNNQNLQRRRAEILRSHNYPVNYTKPRYECSICSDSGFIPSGNMCMCMKKALSLEGIRYSGLGETTKSQRFSNFSLSYYPKAPEVNGKTPYDNMKSNLNNCKEFVNKYGTEEFNNSKIRNMIFYGKTGLGKTHLSSAIAHELIERGFDVVYDTAHKILYAFEKERFSRLSEHDEQDPTYRYLGCDLLIIDDLGTEYSGNMSVSSIYNILNSRIVANKSTLISTNCTYSELKSKYSDRLISRLFGEFSALEFLGEDIRYKKLDNL